MLKRYKIESKFMENFINDLNKVMKDITKLFNEYDIEFCFIGGAARNQYNYRKITEDIDILVSKYDKENFRAFFMQDREKRFSF